MFIVDNILSLPMKGFFAIFREIHKAAEQEAANEADAIRTRLSELYMMLETGQLTEQEFDQQERELLDRLDVIEARGSVEESEEQTEAATGGGDFTVEANGLLDPLEMIEEHGADEEEETVVAAGSGDFAVEDRERCPQASLHF